VATSANATSIVNPGMPRWIFAGFASFSAFRYSVIFVVGSTRFQIAPFLPGLFSFRSWPCQDCGCGKAIWFDD